MMRNNAISSYIDIKSRINDKLSLLEKINVRINRALTFFKSQFDDNDRRKVLLNNFNATINSTFILKRRVTHDIFTK